MKNSLIQFSIVLFATFSAFGQKSTLHNEILQAKEFKIHFENIVLKEVSAEMNVLSKFINPDEVFFFDNTSFDVINNEVKAMNLVLPVKNTNIVLELVEVPEYFYDYVVTDEDEEKYPINKQRNRTYRARFAEFRAR